MTKEEILNLNKEQFFVATINFIDKDKIKNLNEYKFVEEEIISTQEIETDRLDEESMPIFETITITDKLIHICKEYKEGETWLSVQSNLFKKEDI